MKEGMISFSKLEKLLEKDMGDLEPELRQLARIITVVVCSPSFRHS